MAENVENPGEENPGEENSSEVSSGEEDSLEDDEYLFGSPYATKTVENNITVQKLRELASEIIVVTAQCIKLKSKSMTPLKDLLFGKSVIFSDIKGECIQKNTCYFNFSLCTYQQRLTWWRRASKGL